MILKGMIIILSLIPLIIAIMTYTEVESICLENHKKISFNNKIKIMVSIFSINFFKEFFLVDNREEKLEILEKYMMKILKMTRIVYYNSASIEHPQVKFAVACVIALSVSNITTDYISTETSHQNIINKNFNQNTITLNIEG